jgi:hypothetical protein
MKKIIYITIAVLLVALASCSKSWLDINHSPNSSASAEPDLVLPAATVSLGTIIGDSYNLIGGFWSQYWTQSGGSNQYKNIDGYHLLNSDYQGAWTTAFTGVFKNLRYVREQSQASKNSRYVFISTVLECYGYQVMTDLYDSIPFNEALHGGDIGNVQPHYDAAITVYDSIALRLENLFTLDLSGASTAADSKDFLFAGDITRWKQFANTLLLKIYMRQMYVRPSVAQAGVAACFARTAGFLDVDAKLDIFIDAPNKDNPLYESDRRALNTAVNIRSSATFFRYLNHNGDSRFPFLCGPGPDGNSSPTPLAPAQGSYAIFYDASTLQKTSVAVINATDPVYFISTAESYFLQAEAVAAGFAAGNDQALYESGVTAAFAKYGLNASSFITGVYAYPTAGTFEQKQKAIIMQKWISFAGSEGIESFFETNRTHYPEVAPDSVKYTRGGSDPIQGGNPKYTAWNGGQLMYALDGATGGQFPKRLLFTSIERSTNPNTPPEVPLTKKVWWDTK